MKPTLLVAMAPLLASVGYAAPSKLEYELQERCGKVAREAYQRGGWGKGGVIEKEDGSWMLSTYQNHYNSRLNKCFYEQHVQTFPKKGDKEPGESVAVLTDINENRVYGQFAASEGKKPRSCYVRGKRCDSLEAWQDLVKPYMEE